MSGISKFSRENNKKKVLIEKLMIDKKSFFSIVKFKTKAENEKHWQR